MLQPVIARSDILTIKEIDVGRKPKRAEIRVLFFTAAGEWRDVAAGGASRGVSYAGHYWLAQSGGVRPRITRLRPSLRLSLEEPEVMARGLTAKKTFTAITWSAPTRTIR